MKGWLTPTAILGLFALFSSNPSAQWPVYRSARAPRAATGQIDLKAPTPRTASGTPDLSGVWENLGWPELASGSVSGTGGAPGRASVVPPGPAMFFDLASAVPGGLPLQPWAAELKKSRMAANNQDNPDAHCLPMGNMQLHTHPQPRKIIQTPDLIVILYEGNAGVRQIFTDGRRLPANDPQPWWYGYSAGKWDGDKLVVQSSGFRDGGWMDVNGSPLTDAATVTEVFRRPNYGSLSIEVTVDDRKAYTKPWTVTVQQRLMAETELIEFVCGENEKDAGHYDRK
jgi:hypothetical protein